MYFNSPLSFLVHVFLHEPNGYQVVYLCGDEDMCLVNALQLFKSTFTLSKKTDNTKNHKIRFLLFYSNYHCFGVLVNAAFSFKTLQFLKPFVIDERSLPRNKKQKKRHLHQQVFSSCLLFMITGSCLQMRYGTSIKGFISHTITKYKI